MTIRGNLDDPEATLEALLQSVVCPDVSQTGASEPKPYMSTRPYSRAQNNSLGADFDRLL